MNSGKVRWFNKHKGYGFICGPKSEDVFVHYSVIEGEGYKVLKKGQAVLYEYVHEHGPDGLGLKATRVVP